MLHDYSSLVLWLTSFLSIVTAITIHEFSHAFAADRLGDPNPRLQNRLSLNPIRHLDLVGTLMLIFFNFGWGKPVQFDPYNLKNPRRDAALIAAAGPLSNLLTAIVCSLLLFFLSQNSQIIINASFLLLFLASTLTISVVLAVFNLIPLFPLDGSHIISAFLPASTAISFNQSLRKIGPFLLILLIIPLFTPIAPINYILSPITNFITSLLLPN